MNKNRFCYRVSLAAVVGLTTLLSPAISAQPNVTADTTKDGAAGDLFDTSPARGVHAAASPNNARILLDAPELYATSARDAKNGSPPEGRETVAAANTLLVELDQDVTEIEIPVKSSRIFAYPDDIPRVLVADPDVVRAVPISPRQIQVSALRGGSTSIEFWNEAGDRKTVKVNVTTRNLESLADRLEQLFPDAEIEAVELTGSTVALRGTVGHPDTVRQVVEVAEAHYAKVINVLDVDPPVSATAVDGSFEDRSKVAERSRSSESSSLTRELRALRQDVKDLQRDVSRLIRLLEKNGGTVPGRIDGDSEVGESEDKGQASVEKSGPGHEGDVAWSRLGMRLKPVLPEPMLASRGYRGGLVITDVRTDGPAAKQGIRADDILVGMHKWETVDLDIVAYVLNHPEVRDLQSLRFYLVRQDDTLYGHLRL